MGLVFGKLILDLIERRALFIIELQVLFGV